jgi:hypothetical protein
MLHTVSYYSFLWPPWLLALLLAYWLILDRPQPIVRFSIIHTTMLQFVFTTLPTSSVKFSFDVTVDVKKNLDIYKYVQFDQPDQFCGCHCHHKEFRRSVGSTWPCGCILPAQMRGNRDGSAHDDNIITTYLR